VLDMSAGLPAVSPGVDPEPLKAPGDCRYHLSAGRPCRAGQACQPADPAERDQAPWAGWPDRGPGRSYGLARQSRHQVRSPMA